MLYIKIRNDKIIFWIQQRVSLNAPREYFDFHLSVLRFPIILFVFFLLQQNVYLIAPREYFDFHLSVLRFPIICLIFITTECVSQCTAWVFWFPPISTQFSHHFVRFLLQQNVSLNAPRECFDSHLSVLSFPIILFDFYYNRMCLSCTAWVFWFPPISTQFSHHFVRFLSQQNVSLMHRVSVLISTYQYSVFPSFCSIFITTECVSQCSAWVFWFPPISTQFSNHFVRFLLQKNVYLNAPRECFDFHLSVLSFPIILFDFYYNRMCISMHRVSILISTYKFSVFQSFCSIFITKECVSQCSAWVFWFPPISTKFSHHFVRCFITTECVSQCTAWVFWFPPISTQFSSIVLFDVLLQQKQQPRINNKVMKRKQYDHYCLLSHTVIWYCGDRSWKDLASQNQ